MLLYGPGILKIDLRVKNIFWIKIISKVQNVQGSLILTLSPSFRTLEMIFPNKNSSP